MLVSNTLRIDRGKDCSVIDYRIQDDRVETRIVDSATTRTESGWRSVAPEQLRSHVMRNTVLAYWLRRKMGIRRLLRACSLETSVMHTQVNFSTLVQIRF